MTLCLFLCTACVSVKLTPDVEKSKHVAYPPPSNNFEEISVPPADRAWKSRKTGNVISYFTECSPTAVSLEALRDGVLQSMPKAQILSSEVVQHDDREALDSVVEGRVEGVPVQMSLLVYQRNGCRYTLSYSARKEGFETELSEFQRFERGFRAP